MGLLRIGATDAEIGSIKRRLNKQGHWPGLRGFSNLFGQKLYDEIVYLQQTHILEDGSQPIIDGVIGDEVRWILDNPVGEPQRSHLEGSHIPCGLTVFRDRILGSALVEHAFGVKEIPNGSNRSKKPNGGVDKYLPAWGKTKKGPPWCCFFVSWVTKQAFSTYPLGQRAGLCAWAYDKAKKLRMYVPNNGTNVPVPGDAFVMLYKKGGKFTGKGHIGFVYRVSEDGRTINTVEGNCGNRVKIGKRSLSDKSIVGFIDFAKDRKKCKDFQRGLVSASDVGSAATR